MKQSKIFWFWGVGPQWNNISLGHIFELLRQTDWVHFFSKNGPGTIVSTNVGQWKEQPNETNTRAIIVTCKISGGHRGEGTYAAWQTDDTGDPRIMDLVKENAVRHAQSYALPDCRCRVGFHWKCEFHRNWRG